jgi:hypothetical protein
MTSPEFDVIFREIFRPTLQVPRPPKAAEFYAMIKQTIRDHNGFPRLKDPNERANPLLSLLRSWAYSLSRHKHKRPWIFWVEPIYQQQKLHQTDDGFLGVSIVTSNKFSQYLVRLSLNQKTADLKEKGYIEELCFDKKKLASLDVAIRRHGLKINGKFVRKTARMSIDPKDNSFFGNANESLNIEVLTDQLMANGNLQSKIEILTKENEDLCQKIKVLTAELTASNNVINKAETQIKNFVDREKILNLDLTEERAFISNLIKVTAKYRQEFDLHFGVLDKLKKGYFEGKQKIEGLKEKEKFEIPKAQKRLNVPLKSEERAVGVYDSKRGHLEANIKHSLEKSEDKRSGGRADLEPSETELS